MITIMIKRSSSGRASLAARKDPRLRLALPHYAMYVKSLDVCEHIPAEIYT